MSAVAVLQLAASMQVFEEVGGAGWSLIVDAASQVMVLAHSILQYFGLNKARHKHACIQPLICHSQKTVLLGINCKEANDTRAQDWPLFALSSVHRTGSSHLNQLQKADGMLLCLLGCTLVADRGACLPWR